MILPWNSTEGNERIQMNRRKKEKLAKTTAVLASEYKLRNPSGERSLAVVYLGRSNDLWVAHRF